MYIHMLDSSTIRERPLTRASGSLLACQEPQPESANRFLNYFYLIQPDGVELNKGCVFI